MLLSQYRWKQKQTVQVHTRVSTSYIYCDANTRLQLEHNILLRVLGVHKNKRQFEHQLRRLQRIVTFTIVSIIRIVYINKYFATTYIWMCLFFS